MDDDFDDYLAFDVDEDDYSDSDDGEPRISDADLEMAGSLDGESDAVNGMPLFGSYGSSIDLEGLTDQQRDLYDSAYYAGHDAGSDLEDE